MNCKNRIGILVLSLGMLMFLLRPCLVYQLTKTEGYKTNPTSISSLLQRQFKKKDDHHEQQAEVVAIMVITQSVAVCSIHSLLNTINQILTSNHITWYKWGLYHCFQPGAP